MAARVRLSFGICATAIGLAAGALGCGNGGLVEVETIDGGPNVSGVTANDMVASGTVVKNSKYKLVYTMGQPTPQSRVTGGEKTLNGGVVGATQ